MGVREMNHKTWTMPEWMEPYRQYFCNTGGNSIEDLMNGHTSVFTNEILALLEMGVESQVILLQTLRENGLLKSSVNGQK